MVVFGLLQWRAPPILILVCLLVQWQSQLNHRVDRQFLEVFSGHAAITRALRSAGLRGAAIDVVDCPVWDLVTPAAFALALSEIMRCVKGSLVVLAPVCKSYSPTCRFTSGRCCLIPYGYEGLDFVTLGNILGCRTILMCVVASFMGLRWLLEQPSESNLEDLPEFQFLLTIVQVFSGRFYMGIFGANTPKRHVLYSNDEELLNQILAKAGYMSREAQQQCPGATTIKYVDKRGVKRCTGIKQALRDSQHYTREFGEFIADLATTRMSEPLPGPKQPLSLPTGLSDRELFAHYCLPLHHHDLWEKARMMEVVAYLGRSKYLAVPDAWEDVLTEISSSWPSSQPSQ